MKKDKKPRRLRDWFLDIRDALNNIKSDIGCGGCLDNDHRRSPASVYDDCARLVPIRH